jgi:hypothetical protein
MQYALARHQSTGLSHVTPASPDSSHVDMSKSRIEHIGPGGAAIMSANVRDSFPDTVNMSKPTNRTVPQPSARPVFPPGGPPNMATMGRPSMPLTNQPNLPPWTNSPTLGGYFVYIPSTDEIFMRDGKRFPRPPQMQRANLAGSAYQGPLPPPRIAAKHRKCHGPHELGSQNTNDHPQRPCRSGLWSGRISKCNPERRPTEHRYARRPHR